MPIYQDAQGSGDTLIAFFAQNLRSLPPDINKLETLSKILQEPNLRTKFHKLLISISQKNLEKTLRNTIHDRPALPEFENTIRDHLQQYYQEKAAYILPFSHEDIAEEKPWPITQTYRQLAMVIETNKEYTLYVITNLDEAKPPSAISLKSPAIVVTSISKVYFIQDGEWLRNKQGHLLQITGIMLPEQLKSIKCNHLSLYTEGAASIVESILFQYQAVLARDEQLANYENRYQHLEKRRIELKDLLDPLDSHQPAQKPNLQHILVTGRSGIGKSTLLQYIAYRWSCRHYNEFNIAPLWQDRYDFVFWLPLKLLHRDEYVLDELNISPYKRLAYFIAQTCDLYQIPEANTSQFLEKFVQLLLKYKARILLLVDSFDEVAHWILDNKPQSHLLDALFKWSGPMIVTSRPYFKDRIPLTWKIDRWIENEGFLDSDIQAFVTHYFQIHEGHKTQGEKLLHILQKNLGVWSLAHTPLIVRLLCFHWQHASEKFRTQAETNVKELTLTELLQFFVNGFKQRSINKAIKEKSLPSLPDDDNTIMTETGNTSQDIDKWLQILAKLAFEGLNRGENQVLSLQLQQEIILQYIPSTPTTTQLPLLSRESKKQAACLFENVLKLGLLQPVGTRQPNPLQG